MPSPRVALVAAAFLAGLWGIAISAIWTSLGVFSWLGGDFAVNWAAARVLLARGAAAAYDRSLVTAATAPLQAYLHAGSAPMQVGPVSFPPALLAVMVPFALLPPVIGFALWSLLSVLLAVEVVRDLLSDAGRPSVSQVVLALTFYPLVLALLLGQPVVLLLVGLHRAVRAFQRGEEGRAGLWTAMLLLKPQYAVFFGLVYLYKRRWRAVAGMAAGGLLIALASVAVAGTDGMQAYLYSLTQFSGFRDVDPTVAPQAMINWRALLINFAPGVSEAQGERLMLALAVATAATLPLVWRGRWDPRSDRFTLAILATVVVTLLASPHSHAHGATLLLVPALALLNRTGVTPALKLILSPALFVPTVIFVTTGSVVLTGTAITCALIAALITVLVAEMGHAATVTPIPSQPARAWRLKPAATCSRFRAYGSAGLASFSLGWLSRWSSPTARGRSTS